MCRQLWSHNKWWEGLIPFKTFMCQKTHIHNGGLLFCMEKWLCSNWMINHIPVSTIFWEHDLIEGSPRAVLLSSHTGCGIPPEAGASDPVPHCRFYWPSGLLSSPQAPTYSGAPHPGKASHKWPRATGESRDEFFHKLRWQFMPRSKRTDKPHNTLTSQVNYRYYSYSSA